MTEAELLILTTSDGLLAQALRQRMYATEDMCDRHRGAHHSGQAPQA